MSAQPSARTYNQDHIPRKYTPGKRRVSIYWTWSYPWEAQRDPAAMENRFSTMTEVRNVLWPAYETPEWSAAQFLQGIAGTLELFHRSTLSFQRIAGETTGHPVAVFQRIDQAGYKLPIDERILADADTLMVFGLDHILSEQEAAPEEIAAIREWLKRCRRGTSRSPWCSYSIWRWAMSSVKPTSWCGASSRQVPSRFSQSRIASTSSGAASCSETR